jgi:hypothetical protein
MLKTKNLLSSGLLLISVALIAGGCSLTKGSSAAVLKPEEAKATAEKFINENLIQGGAKATITGITLEGDLYKIVIDAGQEKTYDWYMTRDGKKYFPQTIDQDVIAKQKQDQAGQQEKTAADQQKQAENVAKKDKPEVEVFVMSYCPFGTQMEKGILPVAELLKGKADIKIKFCDYAMHGEKEVQENLRQYCIQKDEPAKYNAYLTCFLEASNFEDCLKKAKVDEKKLKTCSDATDKQFNVTKNFQDKASWINNQFPKFEINAAEANKYGITGSPGLVINGTTVSSARDSQSLLTAVCNSFSKKPAECDKKLSSTAPSSGFGGGTDTSGGAAGGCATN